MSHGLLLTQRVQSSWFSPALLVLGLLPWRGELDLAEYVSLSEPAVEDRQVDQRGRLTDDAAVGDLLELGKRQGQRRHAASRRRLCGLAHGPLRPSGYLSREGHVAPGHAASTVRAQAPSLRVP